MPNIKKLFIILLPVFVTACAIAWWVNTPYNPDVPEYESVNVSFNSAATSIMSVKAADEKLVAGTQMQAVSSNDYLVPFSVVSNFGTIGAIRDYVTPVTYQAGAYCQAGGQGFGC